MEFLHEELIIEIFSYLKFKDMCSLTETCHQFNKIISNTSILLKKFRLKAEKVSDGSLPIRKYHCIKLNQIDTTKSYQFGENVIDLQIICTFLSKESHSSDLKKLLNFCPNLKHLEMRGVTIHKNAYDPLPQLKLDSLVIHSEIDYLLTLNECSTEKLVLILFMCVYELLKPFIKRQNRLKVLNLISFRRNMELFSDESLIDVDFELEELHLEISHYSEMPTNQNCLGNFKKFLQKQKKLSIVHLKSLEMREFEAEILNIIGEIPHIKTLITENVNINFHPMINIKSLTLNRRGGKIPRDLHEKFPNVLNLTINGCKNIKFIENIPQKPSKKVNYLQYGKLNSLTLNNVSYSDSPFAYDDIKIDNFTMIDCDTNYDWLIRYLHADNAKFNRLTLHGVKIKENQLKFLEKLNRPSDGQKINELQVILH